LLRYAFLCLLLSACSQGPFGNTQATSAPASPPTVPPLLAATATIVPSFTPFFPTPTPTLTPTVTDTPTETLTPTPAIYPHVFPLQPPSAGTFGRGGHAYPGTDIFAVIGTAFVAVTDGVVNYVTYVDRWDPATDDPALRGGLSVAIIGDDGVRYYGAHLSAIADGIKVGVRVTAGQLLGKVGDTGNSRFTTSHLHFGISRPTYPEDWEVRRGEVDPYPFLIAWRDGINVTPPLPTP
jgi:murein DD-endopeptidase MepM/ murein hydrolase activator NlpD